MSMILRKGLMAIAALAAPASPVHAQGNTTGLVVAVCGTVPVAFVAGRPGPFTVDVNGKLCTSGGSGATAVTAAAVLTANQLVVGDDGARGIKTANATITGSYTWSGTQTINLNAATAPTADTGTGVQLVGANGTVARFSVDTFGALPAFTCRRANGTGASPTAVASGDQICAFNAKGWYVTGGPGYSGPQGSLQVFATQNWSSTAFGTKMVLSTTPNNSTTLTAALTADQDQSVAMAGRATIATSLAIAGATIGTDAFAVVGTTTLGSQLTYGSGPAILTSPAAATHLLGAASVSVGSAVAQTLKVQGSSTNSATPALFTIAGSDNSGTGTNGGGLTMRAGNATGASGTRNGGDVTIQAGTGLTAGGTLIFQTPGTTSYVTRLTIGNDGVLTVPGSGYINTGYAGVGSMGPFGGVQMVGGTGAIAWSLTIGGAASRTVLSEASAGTVQIGTTALNALGSLNLTNLTATGAIGGFSGTAIPAGGTTGSCIKVSSTANFGICFGSGAPTLSAAKGTWYIRSDGTGTTDRAFINTDGGTTWTAVTTAG